MRSLLLALPAVLTLAACARTPEGLQVLDAPAFKAAMEKGNTLVLDVRTPEEHASARIKAPQTLIPVQALEARLKELEAHKDKSILIYCRSGNRSTTAGAILLKAGFKDVRHLAGGIGAWKAKGYAIEP